MFRGYYYFEMEHDQSETLSNNVDWNVFMENIDIDKLIASSEFDKYFPTHAIETEAKIITADKCTQTNFVDEPSVFIDLTNVKKKRWHKSRSKKHKKRKIDPNEIICIDSDDETSMTEETNTNDTNSSSNDKSDSGLSSASVKKVQSIIRVIKQNEIDEFSHQQTANPEQMMVIDSEDENQNTSNSNGCNIDEYEQRPMIV